MNKMVMLTVEQWEEVIAALDDLALDIYGGHHYGQISELIVKQVDSQ